MLHDGSIVSKILDRLVCEISSEALPIIHSVHWIRVRTSDPGTTICGSPSKPASNRSCQAEVSGRILARTADCIFASSESRSLGMRFPRNSDMYLSIFGGTQESRSGLGCSLNRASLSSLVRQRFICLSRYCCMHWGTLNVPSFDLTRSPGSKGVRA